MATEAELKAHPRGQIAVEGSQLMQAVMGRFSFTNGAQLKHTLARSPNGVVLGVRDCNGSIEIDVAEDGIEQPWYTLVRTGKRVNAQYEIPTLNCEIEMVLSGVDTELPVDNSVKLTVNWVGKLKEPVAT